MKETSIKKNIMLSTMYHVLIVLVPFITAPYIARVIQDEGIGIFSFTGSNQRYFSIFAALGTYSYGLREIARSRDSKADRSRLFWEIELLSVITSVVSLLAWAGFLTFAVKQYRAVYLILTLSILETMLDISWFFAGLEQFKYTIAMNTTFKLLGVAMLFIFVKKPSDLLIYVAIMTVTSLLGTMSMWLYLPRFLVRVPFRELRPLRHFKSTLIYFLPTVATSIYTILDKTLIGVITKDMYENGYYEQATKVVNIIKSVTFLSVNQVIGSRASYLFKIEAYDEIRRRINDSMDYILFMGMGCCLGLIGVASRFVPWYFGPGYDPAIVYLQMLSPVVLIIGVSNTLGSLYYSPAGLRAKSAGFLFVGSITNVIMNVIFIPMLKGKGAIIGTLIAEATVSTLYIVFSKGYLTFRQIGRLAWRKLIAGAVMTVFVLFLGTLFRGNLAALLVQIPVGAAIYILLLFLMKDTSMQYVKKMVKMLLRRRKA